MGVTRRRRQIRVSQFSRKAERLDPRAPKFFGVGMLEGMCDQLVPEGVELLDSGNPENVIKLEMLIRNDRENERSILLTGNPPEFEEQALN